MKFHRPLKLLSTRSIRSIVSRRFFFLLFFSNIQIIIIMLHEPVFTVVKSDLSGTYGYFCNQVDSIPVDSPIVVLEGWLRLNLEEVTNRSNVQRLDDGTYWEFDLIGSPLAKKIKVVTEPKFANAILKLEVPPKKKTLKSFSQKVVLRSTQEIKLNEEIILLSFNEITKVENLTEIMENLVDGIFSL